MFGCSTCEASGLCYGVSLMPVPMPVLALAGAECYRRPKVRLDSIEEEGSRSSRLFHFTALPNQVLWLYA